MAKQNSSQAKSSSNGEGSGQLKGETPWTPEQLKQWQAKGDVYICISTEEAGVSYQFAFCAPEWPAMKRIASFVAQDMHLEAGEVILNQCWLGGDDKIKATPVIHLAACHAAVSALSLEVPVFKGGLVKP